VAEGHVLRAQRSVEQAAEVVLGGAEVELRHAMVRRHDGRERILQRLELLYARLHRVAASGHGPGVGEVAVLLQVADRDLPHLRAEVDEIAIVGHPVVVDVAGQAGPQGVRVLQRRAITLVLQDRVFRHVFQPQIPGVAPVEVAELVLQLETALLHHHRRDRRVVLGRDVPVVRQPHFQAARRVMRVVRREDPAAPAILEREAGKRRRDERVLEEAQPGTLGAALLGLVIELDLLRLQPPVLLARGAGAKAAVLEAVLLLADELHAVGLAVRRQSALHEEAGLLEHARIVERVVEQVRAEDAVHALLHAHAALALDAPEFRVVSQGVAENRKLVALDLGAAVRRELDLADTLDLLGVDRDGPGLVRAFRLR
jgi:hypothetical protein